MVNTKKLKELKIYVCFQVKVNLQRMQEQFISLKYLYIYSSAIGLVFIC